MGAHDLYFSTSSADSVAVDDLVVLAGGTAWSRVRGTVCNRSARDRGWVTVNARDRTGFSDEVVVTELPAGATRPIEVGTALTPGMVHGAVVSWVGDGP